MNEKVPCAECGKLVSARLAGVVNGLCLSCYDKHVEKVECLECGKPVPASVASKRNGLCLRCSANRNPFYVLYSSLVEQVCSSTTGFDSLSDAAKRYYALNLFQNEVNNGGFHQFFFNTSGSYHGLIENGLIDFNEPQTLELLRQAKQIVFPNIPVPVDAETRRGLMPAPTPDVMSKLDALDQLFYGSPDTLTPKLEAFAREQGLVP